MLNLIKNRYNTFILIGIIYLILSALLRILLWGDFGIDADINVYNLPIMLLAGVINDLIILLYFLFPLTCLLFLLPDHWFQKRRGKILSFIIIFAYLYGFLYIMEAEFFFFEEFNARFNLVAVDYLVYPHEVFINIWESYPVTLVLLINLAVALGLFYGIWRNISPTLSVTIPLKKRFFVLCTHTLSICLVAYVFSTNTFAFSENRVVNEITANGVSSFFQALATNELDYHLYYRTGEHKALFDKLVNNLKVGGGEFTHLTEQRIDRHFPANPQGLGKLNVVVVVEESFGGEFVGSLGDTRGLTPEFDKLVQQGLFFTNAYATGTRTVRGLEAITLSFPPIPSESVLKRPNNENMVNWGTVMQAQGYQPSFLYGGYGYFDNMNYFYSHNGFEVRDRSDMPPPHFANIWGVSDEDLFNYALSYYDQQAAKKQPFFSMIMTTSNHKPFTFPEGIPQVPASGGGRDAGIRYADYAIGKFIEGARQKAWFNQTVFVFVADHGARVYGKAEIPLKTYRIPLLVYAPQRIPARIVDRPIGQIDIAPTILGLLGLDYEAPFFGQNVFNLPETQMSTLLFNHNHTVALDQGDTLSLLDLNGKTEQVTYDTKNERFTPLAKKDEAQLDLATAYYQLAVEQFQHYQVH
ncbi:phosphoglycerol transferase family protein, alkaline phosphatase superfamily [Beggiatoa alba B18LD]|uniref:Phosphoglycerol transferase family protein, alkaline phosphatase superfamily n=1 Tax=Beggiatoa alba B18LD TaxID=395493 RepID=I3CBW9_9GAMM|nr:LTA synthase family protein [Beggiatoa alba]EIJ41112.1 phosphoglycerol transferase family protein, alkaline phosphatase superfamily [Beggiatoa alba B18LD]